MFPPNEHRTVSSVGVERFEITIVTNLILIFLGTTIISSLTSLLEAVLLSVTPAHVELLVRQKRPGAKALKDLKARIDRPLIAILTLNTLVTMGGSAAVGAETSNLAEASGGTGGWWVALAAGLLSLSVLIIAEIIPKTLGAVYWKPLAAPAATIISFLVLVLTPAVLILEFLPRLISKRSGQSEVTREEIAILAEMGRKSGGIPARESQVIANLLRLNLLRVKDVMTPRVDVFALPASRTAADVAKEFSPLRYSRIPVYKDSIDEVIGLVLRVQVFEACMLGKGDATLGELKTPMHIVPETKSIASLLEEFIKRHEHLFLVVNEYGGTEGIVALEDVIETLLGVDISDEMDNIEKLRRFAIQRMEERRREPRAAARAIPTRSR